MRLLIGALAQGSKRQNEIAELLEIEHGRTDAVLQRLMRIGMVDRVIDQSGPGRQKRYKYSLTENGRAFADAHPLQLSVDESANTLHIEITRGTHVMGL